MKILICNAGSTSLKIKLFEMPKETVYAEGKSNALAAKATASSSKKRKTGGKRQAEKGIRSRLPYWH